MKEINQSNLPLHLGELQSKGTHEIQEKIFFEYLKNHVVSATMVNRATGLEQKCITRYKRKFEKVGLLAEVKTARCRVTGRNVAYITTNKSLFPKPTQLTLF